MATIEELCENIISARSAKDELKDKLDEASAALATLETGLAKLMREGDQTKVTHSGMVFSSSLKIGWKMESAEKERLVVLLKEGAPELVKETVNAASLSSFLRKNEEKLETENATWWTSAKECLARSESESLSIRKQPKKKK